MTDCRTAGGIHAEVTAAAARDQMRSGASTPPTADSDVVAQGTDRLRI
jgi:hypothetical protein